MNQKSHFDVSIFRQLIDVSLDVLVDVKIYPDAKIPIDVFKWNQPYLRKSVKVCQHPLAYDIMSLLRLCTERRNGKKNKASVVLLKIFWILFLGRDKRDVQRAAKEYFRWWHTEKRPLWPRTTHTIYWNSLSRLLRPEPDSSLKEKPAGNGAV